MKITVVSSYFCLTLLLASCAAYATTPSTSTEKKTPTLDYSDPMDFMSDFLNTDIKPEQPLKYWAVQLILLTRHQTAYQPLCKQMGEIVSNKENRYPNKETRTDGIIKAFLNAYSQNVFPADLARYIMKNIKTVKSAIGKRAEIVS
jgi:hypothetical protein